MLDHFLFVATTMWRRRILRPWPRSSTWCPESGYYRCPGIRLMKIGENWFVVFWKESSRTTLESSPSWFTAENWGTTLTGMMLTSASKPMIGLWRRKRWRSQRSSGVLELPTTLITRCLSTRHWIFFAQIRSMSDQPFITQLQLIIRLF